MDATDILVPIEIFFGVVIASIGGFIWWNNAEHRGIRRALRRMEDKVDALATRIGKIFKHEEKEGD